VDQKNIPDISDIKDRLKKHTTKKSKDNAPTTSNSGAFNVAVELLAGVIVGVIMGLFFDNMFDSKPLFLILCLVLGIIASFKSIWNRYIK